MLKRWEGPFTIVKQISPLLYELNFRGTALKSNIVHISRIKVFYDRKELFEKFESNRKSFIPKSLLKHKLSKILSKSENKVRNIDKNSASKTSIENQPNFGQTIDSSTDSSSDSDSDMYENNYISDLSSDSDTEVYYESDNENESQKSSDHNYGVEQGLRRSSRVKFAPNRLNLYFSTIICMLSLITNTNCLANVEPIIWHRVNNPVNNPELQLL